MRAILYTRVSTSQQVNDGVSLDAQESRLQAYATFHGFTQVTVITDAGLSGSTTNREGFQRVMRAIKSKACDAVVVYSLSRFARNTVDTLDAVATMQRYGVTLHSITESLDTSSAIGRFFLTTMSALAQLEREQLGERTSLALQHLKAQGKVYGQIPFGKCLANDGETLIDHAGEMEVIRIVKELNGRGISLSGIAIELETRGIKNRSGNIRWNKTQVTRILKAAA